MTLGAAWARRAVCLSLPLLTLGAKAEAAEAQRHAEAAKSKIPEKSS